MNITVVAHQYIYSSLVNFNDPSRAVDRNTDYNIESLHSFEEIGDI